MNIKQLMYIHILLKEKQVYNVARSTGSTESMESALFIFGVLEGFERGNIEGYLEKRRFVAEQLVEMKEPTEFEMVALLVEKVEADIGCTTEGPVTPYVAIARAIKLGRAGTYPLIGIHDPVAEGLHNVLQTFSYV